MAKKPAVFLVLLLVAAGALSLSSSSATTDTPRKLIDASLLDQFEGGKDSTSLPRYADPCSGCYREGCGCGGPPLYQCFCSRALSLSSSSTATTDTPRKLIDANLLDQFEGGKDSTSLSRYADPCSGCYREGCGCGGPPLYQCFCSSM